MRRIWEKPVAPRCHATEKIISIIDLHFRASIAARLRRGRLNAPRGEKPAQVYGG